MSLRMNLRTLAILTFALASPFETSGRARGAETRITSESRGEYTRLEIDSPILGETRIARVAIPRSYASSAIEYPVIVALDGEFSFEYLSDIVEFLARAGAMPESIVVGIENTQRERDMTPPGMSIHGTPAGADSFLDFVEHELLPVLEREYRLTDLRVLIGHSHGGILASYALCARADLFDAALALDTPAHLDGYWLVDRLIERSQELPDEPIRLIAGEARFDWGDDSWDRLEREAPEGSILHRFRVVDETHLWMAHQGAYRGLKLLFEPYASLEIERTELESIDAQFSAISEAIGGRVEPTGSIYRLAIDQCLLEARADDAEAILTRLVARFGDSDGARRLADEIQSARAEGPLDETVDDLVNGPRPSIEEISPFLGGWAGTQSSNGRPGPPVALDLGIEDQRVVGTFTQTLPSGEERQQEAVVIRFADRRLEIGYMNGMNPRGVLLFALKPDSTTLPTRLEGEMALRGVRFKLPEGVELPTTTMTLTRQQR